MKRKKRRKRKKKKIKKKKKKIKKKKRKKRKRKKKKKKRKKRKKKKKKKNIILTIDEENNICVDCEKKNPTKISINNGVILCEECAKKHSSLGNSISFIKDIDGDLDEYLLNFVVFGSNSKFKRFLISEEVDPSLPIEKKYLTKACYFYRKNLKRKVKGETELLEKDYENANDIVENGNNDFEEFENYKIKSKIMHEGELKQKTNTTLNKIGGSILSVGKKMFGGIKYGANYVAKKTEGPSKNIIKGAGFVGKTIGNAYEKIKNNILKGKNNKEKKEIESEPPKLNEPNLAETGRPLNVGDEIKKEKKEDKKEEKNDNIENNEDKKKKKNEQQQQVMDNNEEKIDV